MRPQQLHSIWMVDWNRIRGSPTVLLVYWRSSSKISHYHAWHSNYLCSVVIFSQEKLNPCYCDLHHERNLLKEHPELQEMLKVAWQEQSFRDIWRLRESPHRFQKVFRYSTWNTRYIGIVIWGKLIYSSMAIQPEQESQPKSGVSTVITKMLHNSHLHVYNI